MNEFQGQGGSDDETQSNCPSSYEGQDEDLVRLRFQSGSLSVRGKSQGMIRIRVMLKIKKVTKKVRVNFRVRVMQGSRSGC